MHLRLLLPITALTMLVAPATGSATFLHTVAPGESLSSIAATDGLSVGELAAANGFASDAQLTAGSTVAIPAPGVQSGSLPTTTPTSTMERFG